MQVRRVVTGHDANRKSVFVSDGPAPRARVGVHHPGFAEALLWSTSATPTSDSTRLRSVMSTAVAMKSLVSPRASKRGSTRSWIQIGCASGDVSGSSISQIFPCWKQAATTAAC